MRKPRYTDEDRRSEYTPSAEQKEGYLSRKWDRTKPGWRSTKPKAVQPVVTPIRKVAK